MIIGIGTDIINTRRMKQFLKPSNTRNMIFTIGEVEHWQDKLHRERHAAGLWAAKEAYKKASGETARPMNEIEVLHHESGAPYLSIHKYDLGYQIHTSISHDGEYATAVVILERNS